ncbi:hypothetical protein BXU11_14065 [Flavobacterium sp. LM5]|uniref:DUF3885 domain-containing protein n=1 Tax=Flavobacterium sp. LM5 TaxID=1938610 RepID=UPI000993B5D6|nr:DUF3885 domain-containing protein [Flavobacterium sp. LM5]OOV25795.1 hypothetical protein BXU11_14065 [Flavobacterium sp. LM5]
MIKDTFKKYYELSYPNSDIDTGIFSIETHIRFELGDGLKNGTKKRINNSVNKSLQLFNDAFKNSNSEVWVIIYDYNFEENNNSNNYIYSQFSGNKLEYFDSQIEDINADKDGIEYIEKQDLKVIIGKIKISQISIKNILTGIANNEMGFEPYIGQSIFFIDPNTDIGFHMYDDRGCYIWSKEAKTITEIYTNRNEWIVDYHRDEIDKYFK